MSLDRLQSCFERCKAESRAALVGYLTAGDPNPATSEKLLHVLAKSADIIEIGMPFSDPMADGPSIQAASERSLAAGTKMHDVFHLCLSVRKARPEAGIVLMGYANVAYAMGYEHFAEQAALAGADGVLIVDIPPEESGDFDAALKAHALHSIRLVAPTSSVQRRELAAKTASGFIYYVSLTGITGAEMGAVSDIRTQVDSLHNQSGLPICVGFGIKTVEQARSVAAFADGVVIGSHFVSCIAEHAGNESAMLAALDKTCAAMRAAMGNGSKP
ncbi:MAG: tryptophan synthase subunit alpha [Zetaproteobacteria bacterium CG12_big_fil_rev_8_21_14_0_65_55_1124]|nr:MAG: tryptophan synthase subunit alpha [Zetaproteobacteria bacterium CG1_02_55_237]PIS20256.1 MAG: tryptophan synthase subunit alpha [Zetaproteobacteria bacterium CG08_land_8_20_14_0_20_55_17]PIW43133.1 MAG: tryptophan synthase subunit alpha [Zetaproteobacteria bacterium CG12_big_fil_rev_8_21_14_0_65_55_1124]PIY52097.1 MAG: tryptophan synthase subunit alpha [Zetaproteobacteria bacterium CG_4_10_14_0_8_um_filter_55_43]PIZ38109.1 MAG: tryptophan synthase subunit alpha [Zetaproteobacteria bacte